MNTFKIGDHVSVVGYGSGKIRQIVGGKAYVEFINYGIRQYAFKFEELIKEKENGKEI